MLHELTAPTSTQPVPHERVPTHVAGVHARCGQGLYLFLFDNRTQLDVYDNPDAPARRKVVIPRSGSSLKAGKFEQGFLFRITSYADHLHRRQHDQTEWAFLDTFRGGYLFDMTHGFETIPNPAAIFERYWLEYLNAFASRHSLLRKTQKARSEWRHLQGETWPEELRTHLGAHVKMIATRICEMAAIAAIPIGQS